MRLLLIISSLVICGFAYPVDENTVYAKFHGKNKEFNESSFANTTAWVFHTRMPEYPELVSDVKIGACTLKEYMLETVNCERKFLLSFRRENADSCSMRLERMKECLIDEFGYCMDGELPEEALQLSIERMKEEMQKYSKFYCSDEVYSITQMLHFFNASQFGCSPGLIEQLDICQMPLMTEFKNNRANLSLCKTYEETVKCVNATLQDHCEFNFGNLSWLFTRRFNPFCDEKQCNKTNPEREVDHDYDHKDEDDYDDEYAHWLNDKDDDDHDDHDDDDHDDHHGDRRDDHHDDHHDHDSKDSDHDDHSDRHDHHNDDD